MNVIKPSTENEGIKYVGYFDGSYTVNIGMGIGVVVYYEDEHKDNIEVWSHKKEYPASPHNTNNVAEYLAFILLLDYFINNNLIEADILIRGDSQLVVEQMNGRYRIKKGKYVRHALVAREKLQKFSNLRLYWCPREGNRKADKLSKIAGNH